MQQYRVHLEAQNLSASTINLRLAAIRKLTVEAADNGLLATELAVGITRIRGAKRVRGPETFGKQRFAPHGQWWTWYCFER